MRLRTISALLIVMAVMFIMTVASEVFVDDFVRPTSLFGTLLAGTVITGLASLAVNVDLPDWAPPAVLEPAAQGYTAQGYTVQMEDGSDLELNVGGRRDAMKAAVDAAVGSVVAAGGAAPSEDEVQSATARAAELLKDPEMQAGMRDLQNLSLSIGLPATREIFRMMIKEKKPRGALKQDCLRTIAEMSPVTEQGCFEVKFYNRARAAPDVAYLLLARCPRGHDLSAQINKLRPHVADERWPEVLRHFSMLVQIGRSVYNSIALKEVALLRQVYRRPADDPCSDLVALRVDTTNTTMFIDESWPERIGIFVKLRDEA